MGRWNIQYQRAHPICESFHVEVTTKCSTKFSEEPILAQKKKRTEVNYHTLPPCPYSPKKNNDITKKTKKTTHNRFQLPALKAWHLPSQCCNPCGCQATLRIFAFDCFCAASTSVTAAPAAVTAASAKALSGSMPAAWGCSTYTWLVPKVDASPILKYSYLLVTIQPCSWVVRTIENKVGRIPKDEDWHRMIAR